MITTFRIKIQYVRPEQKIRKNFHSHFREVRLITVTQTDGVRVDYFDGGAERFAINKFVHVLNTQPGYIKSQQVGFHGKQKWEFSPRHWAKALWLSTCSLNARYEKWFTSQYEKLFENIYSNWVSIIAIIKTYWKLTLSVSLINSWNSIISHEPPKPQDLIKRVLDAENNVGVGESSEYEVSNSFTKLTVYTKGKRVGTKISVKV